METMLCKKIEKIPLAISSEDEDGYIEIISLHTCTTARVHKDHIQLLINGLNRQGKELLTPEELSSAVSCPTCFLDEIALQLSEPDHQSACEKTQP